MFSKKKATKRRLGWVADFCPICRVPRAFHLYRLGAAATVEGVAINQGEFTGFLIVCAECGTFFHRDQVPYLDMQQHPPNNIDALIAKTFPSLPKAHEKRLALEQVILKDPKKLDHEKRQWLLSEPFHHLDPVLESRVHGTHLDGPAAIGCFTTLAMMVAAFSTWYLVPPAKQNEVGIAILSALGLGVVYTFVQMALVPRRFMRSTILPNLARALAPLRPERGELETVLLSLQRQGVTIGKWVKLEALWAQLHSLRGP